MAGNTFGKIFKVTTFGESHGIALGVVIDGCPANIKITKDFIQNALNRRRPGNKNNISSTSRSEDDEVEILSGVFEDKSTGAPIALLVKNTSQNSSDYDNIKTSFRPGHADFTWTQKYGFRDYRGGGRSSGRETLSRVAAGAIAQAVISNILGSDFQILAYTKMVAGIFAPEQDFSNIDFPTFLSTVIEKNSMRTTDSNTATLIEEKISELKKQGDSAGGIIECRIRGVPPGIGECVFDKLDALLAHALLSIGAIKAIEFGAGFAIASMTGSHANDEMHINSDNKVEFLTNNAGGILGGLSTGAEIVFRVAIKPVPSILKEQNTINEAGENIKMQIQGRHDVCLCPRIVPVVEAMSYITIADLLLQNHVSKVSE